MDNLEALKHREEILKKIKTSKTIEEIYDLGLEIKKDFSTDIEVCAKFARFIGNRYHNFCDNSSEKLFMQNHNLPTNEYEYLSSIIPLQVMNNFEYAIAAVGGSQYIKIGYGCLRYAGKELRSKKGFCLMLSEQGDEFVLQYCSDKLKSDISFELDVIQNAYKNYRHSAHSHDINFTANAIMRNSQVAELLDTTTLYAVLNLFEGNVKVPTQKINDVNKYIEKKFAERANSRTSVVVNVAPDKENYFTSDRYVTNSGAITYAPTSPTDRKL